MSTQTDDRRSAEITELIEILANHGQGDSAERFAGLSVSALLGIVAQHRVAAHMDAVSARTFRAASNAAALEMIDDICPPNWPRPHHHGLIASAALVSFGNGLAEGGLRADVHGIAITLALAAVGQRPEGSDPMPA